MRLNLPLSTVFLSYCVISDPKYAVLGAIRYPSYNISHTIPFLIKEPFGPKSNGPLHLERLDNMDSKKEDVQLNLEWQYESSTVENDDRRQNHNHASLRFIFETYNHDGWVIFG